MVDRLRLVREKPLGIGPVLEVDTTSDVDIVAIATWVRAQMRM